MTHAQRLRWLEQHQRREVRSAEDLSDAELYAILNPGRPTREWTDAELAAIATEDE
jgi:hypothetical protein